MSNPNNAAKSGSNKDGRQPTGTCPLKENKIQLVPVRYALTEQAPDHPAIASRHQSRVSFRPVGIRPLREEGYLYVIHSLRRDIIYVYRVDTSGAVTKLEQLGLQESSGSEEYVYAESESALVVERAGSIEVLYSRTPISPKLQSQLLTSSRLRAQLMQRCAIGSFQCTNGATHLLPPDQLAGQLADCHPAESNNPDAFQWCWMKDPAAKMEASTITGHILGQYQQDSAILLLEDPIGMMDELASAYIALASQEFNWLEQDKNRARYFAASHINLLLEVTERQFLANTNNKKIAAYIEKHPQDVEQLYHDYWQAMDGYQELLQQPSTAASRYSPQAIKHSQAYVRLVVQQEKNEQLAGRMGVNTREVINLFNRVKKENDDLRYGSKPGEFGIMERIHHDHMQAWYTDASEKLTLWREACEKIENDRIAMLSPAYKALPVYDKENKAAFLARLETENHWLVGLAELEENAAKVREFFFASLGEQNLHFYNLSDEKQLAVVEEYDSLTTDAIKLAQLKNGMDGLENAAQDLREFQNILNGSALVPMDKASDEIRVQMDRFGAQLAPLAMAEFNELQEKLAGQEKRIRNLFRHAKPGLIAIFLGQAKNAEVVIDIGPGTGADRIGHYLNEMEKIAKQYDDLVSQRNQVEYTQKGKTAAQKDALRRSLNKQINQLAAEAEPIREALGAKSNPIVRPGEKHPSSHIVLKAAGADPADLEKLAELRHKVMTNQILFGSAEGFKLSKPGGLAKSGSLGFLFFVFAASNWHTTLSDFNQKSQSTRLQQFDLVGSTFGMVSFGLSVAVEIARTHTLLEWVKTAEESTQMLCGKIVTLGALATASLSFVSAALDTFKQGNRMMQSWRHGDIHAFAGSAMALAGDGFQLVNSARIAGFAIDKIVAVLRHEINWLVAASETMGLAARLNPWLLLGSALVIGGEIIYNATQSTPLMRWVSQSQWGRERFLLGLGSQNWDYTTQLVKWQEVMQTPRLLIETDKQTETVVSHTGNWYYRKTRYTVTKLRLVIPMTAPEQVKIAAFITISGSAPQNITQLLLSESPQLVHDGLNTVCEWPWPASLAVSGQYQYLDLMIAVKNPQGELLFSEQGGARFTLDLDQLDKLDAVPQADNWYQAKLLEEDDLQLVAKPQFEAALTELKPVLKLNPITGESLNEP